MPHDALTEQEHPRSAQRLNAQSIHVHASLRVRGLQALTHSLEAQTAAPPENLIRWRHNPLAIDPYTAMPTSGVPEAAARERAGTSYTLR